MVDDNSTSTPCLPPDPHFNSADPLDGMSVINDAITVKTMEEEGNLLMPSAVAVPPERSPITDGALPLPPELLPSPPKKNKSTAANNITQGGAVTSAIIRTRPVIAPQDIIDFPSIMRDISKRNAAKAKKKRKAAKWNSANQVDLTQYGLGVMGSTESVSQAKGDTSTVASKQEDAYLQHLRSMREEQYQQQQAASKEEEVNQQEEAYMQHLRAMRAEGNSDELQTEAV